jgi:hypothetical protein
LLRTGRGGQSGETGRRQCRCTLEEDPTEEEDTEEHEGAADERDLTGHRRD